MRELVEVQPAEPAPDASDTRIVFHLELRTVYLLLSGKVVCKSFASVRMLRNFQHRNIRPPRPSRRAPYNIAPGESSRTNRAQISISIGSTGQSANSGRRATTGVPGIGWEAVHVAVDDCTRLAYAEVLADETQVTTAGLLQRAVRYYARRGIRITRVMTDNGAVSRSRIFAAMLATHQLRHLRTRPYTPRTNGKAECFIRTLLAEWAYAQAYRRVWRALTHYLGSYITARPHMGIRGMTPPQKLATL